MISYRNATLSELRSILDWAAKEGWNPGLDDAEAFYAADPKGFFLAVNESDVPVAAISIVNHTSDFAFLGLYIVRPPFRGQGIGFDLWSYAMRHAGDRTIGLDGVEAQQDNYRASGFVHAGGTTRFTGEVLGKLDQNVRATKRDDFTALIEMEAKASGVAKLAYLRAWLSGASTRTTIVLETEGTIQGFCTARTCRVGTKIGPLVAVDATVAHRLIANVAAMFEGPVTLDVPETSTALLDLCGSLGLEAGFKTARMYRGRFANPGHKCFAVSSLELG